MDNNFFAYLQQLEAMAFFSGFPLLYALVHFLVPGAVRTKSSGRRYLLVLSTTYAITATLYLGLQLKNLYPDYSISHISRSIQSPWLVSLGIMAVLCWLPSIRKRPLLALLHSLVFFSLLAKDLVQHLIEPHPDRYVVQNDMQMYTASFLLNLVLFILALLFTLLVSRFKRPATPAPASERL